MLGNAAPPVRRGERVATSCIEHALYTFVGVVVLLVLLFRLFIGPYRLAEHACERSVKDARANLEGLCAYPERRSALELDRCSEWQRKNETRLTECILTKVMYDIGPCSFGVCDWSFNAASVVVPLVTLVAAVLVFAWAASAIGSVFALLARALRATELPLADDREARDRYAAYAAQCARPPPPSSPAVAYYGHEALMPPPPYAPGYVAPGTVVYAMSEPATTGLRQRHAPALEYTRYVEHDDS
jgi:hypothetical protein